METIPHFLSFLLFINMTEPELRKGEKLVILTKVPQTLPEILSSSFSTRMPEYHKTLPLHHGHFKMVINAELLWPAVMLPSK